LVHGTFAVVRRLLGEAAAFMDTAPFASPREEDPIVRTIVGFLRWEGDRRLPTAYRRLGEQNGWRSKAGIVLRTIFPRRKEMRRIYRLREGSLRVYGCYLLRPIDLLVRRGGIALRLALHRSDLGPRNEWERSRLEIGRWIDGASRLPLN
jgi:hypothetical protein